MMRRRKGQLQIGESIMVIIILAILGIIGLVFYANFAKQEYEIKFNEYEELNALETAQLVTSLYELRCAKPGVTDLCFDLHKVVAFSSLKDNYVDYYYDIFRNSKVTLQIIYPTSRAEEFIIYSQDASNSQNVRRIDIPIPVHDGATDELLFGVLTIERFF